MLARFSVEGFKGFDKKIELDLQNHNDYQFNNNMIKNDLINKVLIYGKNGSGKTNIGYALFDLVFHLTDKDRNMQRKVMNSYLNLNNLHKYAEFCYEFKFDSDYLIYKYRKENINKLIYEELILNGESVLKYDFNKFNEKLIKISEAQNLNWIDIKNQSSSDENLSLVKYIFNNTLLSEDSVIYKFKNFVNGMLWFRSVEANGFIGLKNSSADLAEIIINNGKTKDFEKFLNKCGLKYKLVELTNANNPNEKKLCIDFGKSLVEFNSIVSSGTKALWLYYCWNIFFDNVSFLFIDEFDATYHFELAASIVEDLKNNDKFQSVLTTHNTYLMSNKLSRPDCTFILSNNTLKSLTTCTDKELREAHNIEKLYRNGAFTE